MRFATHPVRQHKQVQRGYNAKAVLVVGAHATHVGHAAAHNLHKDSTASAGHTQPARTAGNPVPTLTDRPSLRKAMNPTNYSLFRHISVLGARHEAAGLPTPWQLPLQSSNAPAPFYLSLRFLAHRTGANFAAAAAARLLCSYPAPAETPRLE